MTIEPWVEGPFELIVEAELHHRAGGDSDRRLALINFDNAVEVTISAYLGLHPSLRGNRPYPRDDVTRWLENYHTRLDFLFGECERRKITAPVRREVFVYFHDLRGEQYHGGRPVTPYVRDVDHARQAAIWTFAMLFDFDVETVEAILEERVHPSSEVEDEVERSDVIDIAIDEAYGLIDIGGNVYLASEVLYLTDPLAYRELGIELLPPPTPIDKKQRSSRTSNVGNQRSAG